MTTKECSKCKEKSEDYNEGYENYKKWSEDFKTCRCKK